MSESQRRKPDFIEKNAMPAIRRAGEEGVYRLERFIETVNDLESKKIFQDALLKLKGKGRKKR